jgi:hypothetical protein
LQKDIDITEKPVIIEVQTEKPVKREVVTMTKYTEKGNITIKTEFTDFDEIGWSCLDARTVYKATVTEFSIAEGIIRVYTKVVNADGSDYKPAYYRNHWNGFSPT